MDSPGLTLKEQIYNEATALQVIVQISVLSIPACLRIAKKVPFAKSLLP
jgi:hypothetical protein